MIFSPVNFQIMFVFRCHHVYQKKYISNQLILRYYLPNKVLSPKKYAHSLLILFFPFSSESQLLKDSSYCDRLQELNVLETVRRNRRKFEPDNEVIDFLYMQIQKNANDSKKLCLPKLVVMITIVVKNTLMIIDSQIPGPKLGL